MIELSDEKVIELINEIVAEKGEDFVYRKPELAEGCMYVHINEGRMVPGCIVAHFFVRAGIPIEKLFPLEGESALAVASHLWVRELLNISETAANFLVVVQDHQDQETSWGESVRWARGELEI